MSYRCRVGVVVFGCQKVMDQPTMVRLRTRRRAAVLTTLRRRPWPRRESRDSASMQRRTETTRTTAQARIAGRPGYLLIIERNSPGGWPAGIHHGIMGATPAARERVSSLRVNQPLTFGRASFQTK